jgi:hypothetical protein
LPARGPLETTRLHGWGSPVAPPRGWHRCKASPRFSACQFADGAQLARRNRAPRRVPRRRKLIGIRAERGEPAGILAIELPRAHPHRHRRTPRPHLHRRCRTTLPASRAGIAEIAALDKRIELHRNDPDVAIRGRLEDYVEALRRSRAWVSRAPASGAHGRRALVLVRVHEFAAARQTVARARSWVRDPSELEGLAATIDELQGSRAPPRIARRWRATIRARRR